MATESATQKHVLVVDDEPDFAALLRTILSTAGYAVSVAHNCEDALVAARRRRPDLITLDVGMPRKSGAFFYRKLKTGIQYRKCRKIPVVFVTAVTRDREMDKLVRSLVEADDVPHPQAFLEKPVDGPELLAVIQKTLAGE
jgi:two-component system alkaline phosphatase synthesis response regulator PhoP